jgi:hypothetical protein
MAPKQESQVTARLQAASAWLSESSKVVGASAKMSLETGFLKDIVSECGEGLGMASALCKLGAFALDKATPEMSAEEIIAHAATRTFWKTMDEECANWTQPITRSDWKDYVREHLDERTARALASEFSWMSVITPDGQFAPCRSWRIVADFVGLAEVWLHATGMETEQKTAVKKAVGEAIAKTLSETITKTEVAAGFRGLIDDVGTQAVKALVELQTGIADTLLFGETKQSDLYVPSRAKIADLTFGEVYPTTWDDVKTEVENAEEALLTRLREPDAQLVIIEGEMGIGKSCLMRRITSQLSEEYTVGGREPILVRWKDLYEGDRDLRDAVKEHIQSEYGVSPPDLTLGAGTVLLVDGFDEMTSHDPTFIGVCFRRLVRLHGAGCTIVVAMRTPVVTSGMKEEWAQCQALVCHIMPFADEQVDRWAEKWAAANEDDAITGDALRAAASGEDSSRPSADGVTQVPLLLYMVAKYVLPRTTGRAPLNRTAVFRIFVDETIRGTVENSAAQRVQTTADYEPVAYRLLLQELAAIASWPKSAGVCRKRDIEDVIPEAARKQFTFARGITPFVLHFFSPADAHGEFHFYPEGFREYLLAEWSVRQQLEWRGLRGSGHEEFCRSPSEARNWLGELALREQETTFLNGIYEELGTLARERSDDVVERLKAFGCQKKTVDDATKTVEDLYEAARAYADYPEPSERWGDVGVSVGSPEGQTLPPAYNDLSKVFNALTQCWVATLGVHRGLQPVEPVLQRDRRSLARYIQLTAGKLPYSPSVEMRSGAGGKAVVAGSSIGLSFADVNLTGAELVGTSLTDADLRGVALNQSYLAGARLVGADLSHARMMGAMLFAADLYGANLYAACLDGAILQGVRLAGTSLERAHMEGADLRGAVLVGADMTEAKCTRASLVAADLSGADLTKTQLTRANLRGANLADVSTHRDIASIRDANIYNVRNAPEGFTEWALANGAVQKDGEAWHAFVKNDYKEPDDEDTAADEGDADTNQP